MIPGLDAKRIAVAGATSYLARRTLPILRANGALVAPVLRAHGTGVGREPVQGGLPAITLTSDLGDMAVSLQAGRFDALVICVGKHGRHGESAHDLVLGNVAAPAFLLEAAILAGIRCVVSMGTALPPETGAYALTKNQFVDLARTLAAGKTRFCSLRSEIFYGPGEGDATKLPQYVISGMARAAPTLSFGSGREEREFTYVDDVARALGYVVGRDASLEPGFAQYDVSSGRRILVRDFVELVKRLSGAKTELRFGVRPDRTLTQPIALDTSSLRHLGWSPQVELEAGIRHCLADRSGG